MLSNYICINSSMQTQLGHMEDVRCLCVVCTVCVRKLELAAISFVILQSPMTTDTDCISKQLWSCYPLAQFSLVSSSRRIQLTRQDFCLLYDLGWQQWKLSETIKSFHWTLRGEFLVGHESTNENISLANRNKWYGLRLTQAFVRRESSTRQCCETQNFI